MAEKTSRPERKATRAPTVTDVARAAGVGTTTVSRVINGGHYVNPKTMSRVQDAIARLGYQPSQAARALKSLKTRSIGLIVPTLRDAFFAEIASAVQEVTKRRGYVLLVLASEDDQLQETKELNFFRSYRVDGMLVVAPRTQSSEFSACLRALSIPIVAVDRPLGPQNTAVLCNNYDASRQAVRHLLDHGRRRIMCLGGDPGLYTIQERVRGYEDTLRSVALAPNRISSANPAEIPRHLHKQFMNNGDRPDAIFALTGAAATHSYQFLSDANISIPGEVALLGFDDFPLSGVLRPAVSVIRQPTIDIGTIAAKTLLDEVEAGATTPRKIILETTFLERASCGCAGPGKSDSH